MLDSAFVFEVPHVYEWKIALYQHVSLGISDWGNMRESSCHISGEAYAISQRTDIAHMLRIVCWQNEDLVYWHRVLKFQKMWSFLSLGTQVCMGAPVCYFMAIIVPKVRAWRSFFFHMKRVRLLAICFTCGGGVVWKAVALGKIDIFSYTLSSIIVKVSKWLIILTPR